VADQCQVAQVIAGVTGGSAVQLTFINTPPSEGCTPGFWQGGFGSTLWDIVDDPDWTANGGAGTNPFKHDTLFNSFFDARSELDGLRMIDIIGTGGGNNPVRKASRDVVAAYLNSAFGLDYPFSTGQIDDFWSAAVLDGGMPAFKGLHDLLAPANQLGCYIP
jgi:hypothetical protein